MARMSRNPLRSVIINMMAALGRARALCAKKSSAQPVLCRRIRIRIVLTPPLRRRAPSLHFIWLPPPSLKDTSVLVVLYSESPIVPKNAVLGLLELYCPWAPRLVAHLREGAAVICANVVCEGRRS